MTAIIGIVVLFFCVFGGFVIAGGSLAPIIKAAPYEAFIIGGAGLGSFGVEFVWRNIGGVGLGCVAGPASTAAAQGSVGLEPLDGLGFYGAGVGWGGGFVVGPLG